MKQVNFTNKQARQFILLKQGLMGNYKFTGEQGVCDYIKQAGCIQFDPIDVCGKNAELVLQSRVEGFSKDMLYKLLYKDRMLVDYFDKNMSIFSVDDWKYFSPVRAVYDQYGRNHPSHIEINAVMDEIRAAIKAKGYISSKDIDFKEKINWAWNPTTLARAALEIMYFRGELIIHHKKGNMKHYALASGYIADEILNSCNPNLMQEEQIAWGILRRIGAVGMLWNKPSDAWLGIDGLKAVNRKETFKRLLADNKIIEISIQNIADKFYCLSEDKTLINRVLSNSDFVGRTEFVAPLDNMIWDRKLIKLIFNFDYKWEIYTPIVKRKFGHYVLPVLSGDCFNSRIEIISDKKLKQLIVKNLWLEEGINNSDRYAEDIHDCLKRFSVFNNCEQIKMECKI